MQELFQEICQKQQFKSTLCQYVKGRKLDEVRYVRKNFVTFIYIYKKKLKLDFEETY